MTIVPPRTMPGTMELLPHDQIALQRMLDVIRRGYERFGFLPVETPVMEFTDVLLTKSGGDTEKQVYFVQSTGALAKGGPPELALRFDLTVPLARYVAEHEGQLSFPFRRYQIQRVYRGERAQRGRYREFYQCDIDVIGKDRLGLQYDAEIPMVIYHVFRELGIGKFTIRLNHRQVLLGYAEGLGIVDPLTQQAALREIDKLDKIGRDKVRDQLTGEGVGLSAEVAERLLQIVDIAGTNDEVLAQLTGLTDHPPFASAIAELNEIVALLRAAHVEEAYFRVDPGIARGLDYYTGTVYETTLDDHPEIGSICSGGRYENLAGHYTKSKLPGVGISIGATRLFYQLQQRGLIANARSLVSVLVTRMDDALASDYLRIASDLRAAGVNTEVVLESSKMKKQLQYAVRSRIGLVVILGGDEAGRGVVQLKNLETEDQREIRQDMLVAAVTEELARSCAT